jgi:antitoxin component of MazEF toxin-antitoxin module
MKYTIERSNNSSVAYLPDEVLESAKLHAGNLVLINIKDCAIVIEANNKSARKIKLPFSEKDLLGNLNAYTAHSDELIDSTAEFV